MQCKIPPMRWPYRPLVKRMWRQPPFTIWLLQPGSKNTGWIVSFFKSVVLSPSAFSKPLHVFHELFFQSLCMCDQIELLLVHSDPFHMFTFFTFCKVLAITIPTWEVASPMRQGLEKNSLSPKIDHITALYP